MREISARIWLYFLYNIRVSQAIQFLQSWHFLYFMRLTKILINDDSSSFRNWLTYLDSLMLLIFIVWELLVFFELTNDILEFMCEVLFSERIFETLLLFDLNQLMSLRIAYFDWLLFWCLVFSSFMVLINFSTVYGNSLNDRLALRMLILKWDEFLRFSLSIDSSSFSL